MRNQLDRFYTRHFHSCKTEIRRKCPGQLAPSQKRSFTRFGGSKVSTQSSGGSKGQREERPLPSGPKFLHFHAVFGKIWPNNKLVPPSGVGVPSSGKSWIRHYKPITLTARSSPNTARLKIISSNSTVHICFCR